MEVSSSSSSSNIHRINHADSDLSTTSSKNRLELEEGRNDIQLHALQVDERARPPSLHDEKWYRRIDGRLETAFPRLHFYVSRTVTYARGPRPKLDLPGE